MLVCFAKKNDKGYRHPASMGCRLSQFTARAYGSYALHLSRLLEYTLQLHDWEQFR